MNTEGHVKFQLIQLIIFLEKWNMQTEKGEIIYRFLTPK